LALHGAADSGAAVIPADRWTTTDWVVLASLPTATALLIFADEPVRSFARDHRDGATRSAAAAAKVVGEGRATIPVAGLLWWAGSSGRAPRLARASLNGLEAWTLTQAVAQTAKYTLGRARPRVEAGNLDFAGVVLRDDSRHSFPSGHTATAWGLLPAYAMEYDDHPWIAGTLWAVAAAVPLSRIHDDQHWLSDVAFSAGVGWLSNRAIRSWNCHTRAPTAYAWILPTQDGWTAGITRTY